VLEAKDTANSPTPDDVSFGRIRFRPWYSCFRFRLETHHKTIYLFSNFV